MIIGVEYFYRWFYIVYCL